MYCVNCGQRLSDNANFCSSCGSAQDLDKDCSGDIGKSNCRQRSHTMNQQYRILSNYKILTTIERKEIISLMFWFCIVLLQIILGIRSKEAIYFMLATWNIICCCFSINFIFKIKTRPVGIYSHYNRNGIISTIFWVLINLRLGVTFSIIAVIIIFDLFTRNYVLKHKEELMDVEQEILSYERFEQE